MVESQTTVHGYSDSEPLLLGYSPFTTALHKVESLMQASLLRQAYDSTLHLCNQLVPWGFPRTLGCPQLGTRLMRLSRVLRLHVLLSVRQYSSAVLVLALSEPKQRWQCLDRCSVQRATAS
jgi:hypothetical protein